MIIRSEKIAELLKQSNAGQIKDTLAIIPSPNIEQLEKKGSTSVDLHLGTWFMSLRAARMTSLKVDEESPANRLTKTHFVPFGDVFFLHPRNFVLGITLEWLRLPPNLAGYVVGKSSWGRRGLVIATATGVHPGFKGCLTLELSNVGEIPIELKPGYSVCQLFLHNTDGHALDIDQSSFIGRRRPTLGMVKKDDLTRRLASLSNDTTPQKND